MHNVNTTKLMYSEVLGVLITLSDHYINKLPEDLMELIIENSDSNYLPVIAECKRIEEQNISKSARAFLTMLKLKYWCETEDEKKELLKILKTNEDVKNKKYSYEDLFNNNNNRINNSKMENIKSDSADKSVSLTEIKKETIFTKIINWIKKIFK